MKYSKEQLLMISGSTGFRTEIIEKVLLLMDLLEDFFSDPLLRHKIVLKGGTALNLFYLNLPRLSVDIDLNYIGAIDKITMLRERSIVEKRIFAFCERQGFSIRRQPTVHAGGKLVWRYPSALEHTGSLEIDLNFMYRVPLLPIDTIASCKIGERSINNISVLNINELAAGKFSALIDRALGRDLFDSYQLLSSNLLDIETFRLILIVYLGMSRKKDIREIRAQSIVHDFKEFQDRLLPMLSRQYLNKVSIQNEWAKEMLITVQNFLQYLFPLREHEQHFLNALLDFGEIKPELLTNDVQLQDKIKLHPAVQWSAYNIKRNK